MVSRLLKEVITTHSLPSNSNILCIIYARGIHSLSTSLEMVPKMMSVLLV